MKTRVSLKYFVNIVPEESAKLRGLRGNVSYVGAWVAWVKIFFTWINVLRGSIYFCVGQFFFCVGPNFFVWVKLFCVGPKFCVGSFFLLRWSAFIY